MDFKPTLKEPRKNLQRNHKPDVNEPETNPKQTLRP